MYARGIVVRVRSTSEIKDGVEKQYTDSEMAKRWQKEEDRLWHEKQKILSPYYFDTLLKDARKLDERNAANQKIA